MNRPPFFPDPVFGWAFCGVLIALTGIAAWKDIRTTKIPNRLTVTILALGLVASALRGGFLAANNLPVWWLWKYDPGAVWLGVVDGLLYAVTGFLVTFTAIFFCWIFGLCGGGDVKLFGAIGAWLGFAWFPLLWLVSVAFLFVWMIGRLIFGGFSPRQIRKSIEKAKQASEPTSAPKPGLRVTYSLPVALATILVLLWAFRVELQLVPPKAQANQQQDAAICGVVSVPC